MSARLGDLRSLLIDMDGVLWRGDETLPGVTDFFDFLDKENLSFILVTNNATRRSDHTINRLAGLGVKVQPSQVLTSAEATARWVKTNLPGVSKIVVVGEQALIDELTQAGFSIVQENADAVVVGLDRGLTYDKLSRAALEIRAGAKFIATNTDLTLPTEKGLVPGSGSIVAALVAATGVEPVVIGKPFRPMFSLALDSLHTAPESTAMLGDRLDTDIDGASRAGLKTILVLTGVSTRLEAETNPIRPDFIFADLPELIDAWAKDT